jgi:hypothetical protein
MTNAAIDIEVSAESGRFDEHDERWLCQVRDFYNDLRIEIPGFRLASTMTPETKGTVDTVILALGSAGAFSSTLECFKAWLARDKSRRIRLVWRRDGHKESIELNSGPLDAESLRRLSEAIGQGLGEGHGRAVPSTADRE